MNINDLTIGQAKELASMFGKTENVTSPIYQRLIGKKVIVRSYSEGVNFGEVVIADETGIVLKNARRLHYMAKSANGGSWYEAVSKDGLGKGSRVSVPAEEKVISEKYSATLCSDTAVSSIEGWPSHEG